MQPWAGINKNTLVSMAEVLLQASTRQQVLLTTSAGVDLLPANDSLTVAEVTLLGQEQREHRLKTVWRV